MVLLRSESFSQKTEVMDVCCIFTFLFSGVMRNPWKALEVLRCGCASKAQMVIDWKARQENNDDTQ